MAVTADLKFVLLAFGTKTIVHVFASLLIHLALTAFIGTQIFANAIPLLLTVHMRPTCLFMMMNSRDAYAYRTDKMNVTNNNILTASLALVYVFHRLVCKERFGI